MLSAVIVLILCSRPKRFARRKEPLIAHAGEALDLAEAGEVLDRAAEAGGPVQVEASSGSFGLPGGTTRFGG
jgi:hypothetical protein